MKILKFKTLLIVLFLFVTSCTSKIEEPQVLYDKALDALYGRHFETAIRLLDNLDENYPYTKYSDNAITLLTYAHYKVKKYSEVIGIVDFFIQINPKHPNIPYLLYLKALSFYDQVKYYKKDKQILYEFIAIQSIMNSQMPNSIYTADINKKTTFIKKTILAGELDVAIQYQSNYNCIAAVNRYLSALKISNEETDYIIKYNANSCLEYLGITSYTF